MNEPTDSDEGAMHPSLRVVRYGLSALTAFHLWFFCSPYKLHHGNIGRQYYNDDGIFFGALASILLLLVHGGRAFGMRVVYRKKPSILTLAFMLFYFLKACYWVCHANSIGAMHEY